MTKTSDTPKQNVGIYCRVSTDKQDNGNQLEQLREFAARQGWAIAVEYVDTVSGSGKKTRPQFERMLLAASQRKFDLLLFWALDRLSREGIVRTLGYLEQLRAWNIGWRSYTQPFLDTGNAMTNGIVLSVLSAVAQQERVTISERTKAGLQRAKRAGRTLGRRAVSVDLARVERCRVDGMGLRAIAAKLGISVNTLQRARVRR
jgi:DNA invertase Pin-like site-specific DNA recombinase